MGKATETSNFKTSLCLSSYFLNTEALRNHRSRTFLSFLRRRQHNSSLFRQKRMDWPSFLREQLPQTNGGQRNPIDRAAMK